jgi:hypothetical protein
MPIWKVFPIMDSMSLALRASRVALFGIALVLGSLGIFCLYVSCVGAPLAAPAIVCLGSATAIVLACEGIDACGPRE